jgi:vacuolar-type H+-ATPase subunit H
LDVLHLIDRLEELVAEAKRMPIGQGVVIDRRRILELIDQMRSTLPWEVREAQEIVLNRDAVIEEARREGEGIIHRAQIEAEGMLDETEIIKQAEVRAQEILQQADERAQDLLDEAQQQVQAKLAQAEQAANNQMDEADRYALEMLRRLEQQLNAFSATVRAGIESLEVREAQVEEDVQARP